MPRQSHGVMLVLSLAEAEARAGAFAAIEPVHLLLGFCKAGDLPLREMLDAAPAEARNLLPELEDEVGEIRQVLAQAALDAKRFRRRLRATLGAAGQNPAEPALHRSGPCRKVFERGEQLARESGVGVRPVHLLAALLEIHPSPWQSVLDELQVQAEDLLRAVRDRVPGVAKPPHRSPDERKADSPPVAAAKKGPPSILAEFGRDLTRLARDGKLGSVIGRREEMKTLAQILLQKRKSNAILVGEPGVGKTGVVEGLAQRIVGPKPPPGLAGKRVVEVTMAALVAGTKYRGEFEERMQGLLRETTADPNVILFIDEIHTLLGAGGSGSSDAANILKPALARGELTCIGATTIAEYRQFIEKDAALQRRFQVVWIDEPSRDETVAILQGLQTKFAEHHGLKITDEAIAAAVDLSIRYLPEFRLPDKALDLLDQACSQARMVSLSFRSDLPAASASGIGRAEIARVVSQRCRIPVDRLAADEAERLLRIEEHLRHRVIGQDAAVQAVSAAVRTARVGLRNPQRPQAVFLFLGSTGTGKTELAKALAEFLFDDERRLIRFDMSEYMESHSVAKLIGAPPGYIGHDQEGLLTGAVRTNPYSVVLFDEIEKAHPRVLDLFLQIFDDGRLTDAQGRRASFTETILILTSNLGCGTASRSDVALPMGFVPPPAPPSGEPPPDYRARILDAVRAALRPELVNRIGEMVIFNPLTAESVRRIIDKFLDGIRQRLSSRRLRLSLAPEVYDWLMSAGYNPEFGARLMERVIETQLVQPLGQALLSGRFQDGDEVQVVRTPDGIALTVPGKDIVA